MWWIGGASMIGQSLSHFQITAKLGEGGMGEVYRAEDTRLGREVAIKVLPAALTADGERLARLEREAKILASLNHPHIAMLHQYEQDGGQHFLVMELVEGETLAERIGRGSVPVDEALGVAAEIAQGLEAAHQRGVVHRDLKPANIKLTPDGEVKILDFGIAKALESAPSDPDFTSSPTMEAELSRIGEVTGTAAYMSPEQARGEEVDRRTDVWAFGCVLYEMLTARPIFGGRTVADCISNTLTKEPDWNALPADLPPSMRRLLRHCLVKDAKQRLHDIADARIELEDRSEDAPSVGAAAAEPVPGWRRAIPWVVVPLAVLLGWFLRPQPPETPLPTIRFELPVPASGFLTHYMRHGVAFSPDGKYLAFVASQDWFGESRRIYLHDLARNESRPLPGTEKASQLVFSPDGRWLAFFRDQVGLLRIDLEGGEPQTICDCRAGRGAAWAPDGSIIFGETSSGLQRVSAAGGEPTVLTRVDATLGEVDHRMPHLLPDGDTVLFTVTRGDDEWERAQIVAVSLSMGERKVLLEGGSDARFIPPEYLVYALEGRLLAVRFDPRRLEVSGPAVPVLDGVVHSVHASIGFGRSGVANFDVSASGTLVYMQGSVFPEEPRRVALVERDGTTEDLDIEPKQYLSARMGPDGRRVLLSTHYGTSGDVWIQDTVRGSLTRQTFDGGHGWSIWGPGPEEFTVVRRLEGRWSILVKGVGSGPGEARELASAELRGHGAALGSWSPDGQTLAVLVDGEEETRWDIWTLGADGTFEPLIASPFSERFPDISPDGRWIAYSMADEEGRSEVFVRSFPEAGPAVQVSTGGEVVEFAWTPDGREIVYRAAGGFYAVKIDGSGDRIESTRPELLFEADFAFGGPSRTFDLLRDGRLLLIQHQDMKATGKMLTEIYPKQLQIVQNWAGELAAAMGGGQ